MNGEIAITPAGEGRLVNLQLKSISDLIGEGVLEELKMVKASGASQIIGYKFKTLDGETAAIGITIKNKIVAYTVSGNYEKYTLLVS